MSRTAAAALGTLGTRIELRRRALKLSIEDTAARLGVNPRTVRAVEMGRPTVKVGSVFAYPTSSVSACSGWKAMSLSAPDAQGRTLSRCSRP